MDSQYSADGGVLVQVTGTLRAIVRGGGESGGETAAAAANGSSYSETPMRATGPPRKFCQAIVLAPQEKGFFVLTDIFRYLPAERRAAAEEAR